MDAPQERSVVVVGYDDADLLDIAGVTSSLDVANRFTSTPYAVALVTPGGAPVRCDNGLVLAAQSALERCIGAVDTLVVAGGAGHLSAGEDGRLVGHVRRLAAQSRRVASVGTGATVLAAAGLLDGRRVTTHWRDADRLAADHPALIVDPGPLFIRDEGVATAAGVTSAVDLTLSFIEEDHGPQVARRVARHLVTYLQRPGDQAQMSIFMSAPPTDDDLVRALMNHIVANLDEDLRTEALAARAGVCKRHLTRLFSRYVGETPGRHIRRVRLEAAAQLLAGSSMPLETIAQRCGFRSAESLRQVFVLRYGVSPRAYRDSRRVPLPQVPLPQVPLPRVPGPRVPGPRGSSAGPDLDVTDESMRAFFASVSAGYCR